VFLCKNLEEIQKPRLPQLLLLCGFRSF